MDRSVPGGSLTHYGVKGMKWGVRRSDAELDRAASRRTRSSEDHKAAVSAQRKIDSSGTQALSNKELQGLISRMNLERQYYSMQVQHKSSIDRGHEQVKKYLAMGKTYEEVRKFMDSPTGKAVKTGLKTAVAAGFGYVTGGTGTAAAAGAGVVVRKMTQ